VKLYKLSSDQGNVIAQYNLGLKYFKGEGVPRDITQSLKYFQLSANQGFEKAKQKLDSMK